MTLTGSGKGDGDGEPHLEIEHARSSSLGDVLAAANLVQGCRLLLAPHWGSSSCSQEGSPYSSRRSSLPGFEVNFLESSTAFWKAALCVADMFSLWVGR